MQTFMDIAHEMEHVSAMKHREEATGILFNPNHYKANKEVRQPKGTLLTVSLRYIVYLVLKLGFQHWVCVSLVNG